MDDVFVVGSARLATALLRVRNQKAKAKAKPFVSVSYNSSIDDATVSVCTLPLDVLVRPRTVAAVRAAVDSLLAAFSGHASARGGAPGGTAGGGGADRQRVARASTPTAPHGHMQFGAVCIWFGACDVRECLLIPMPSAAVLQIGPCDIVMRKTERGETVDASMETVHMWLATMTAGSSASDVPGAASGLFDARYNVVATPIVRPLSARLARLTASSAGHADVVDTSIVCDAVVVSVRDNAAIVLVNFASLWTTSARSGVRVAPAEISSPAVPPITAKSYVHVHVPSVTCALLGDSLDERGLVNVMLDDVSVETCTGESHSLREQGLLKVGGVEVSGGREVPRVLVAPLAHPAEHSVRVSALQIKWAVKALLEPDRLLVHERSRTVELCPMYCNVPLDVIAEARDAVSKLFESQREQPAAAGTERVQPTSSIVRNGARGVNRLVVKDWVVVGSECQGGAAVVFSGEQVFALSNEFPVDDAVSLSSGPVLRSVELVLENFSMQFAAALVSPELASSSRGRYVSAPLLRGEPFLSPTGVRFNVAHRAMPSEPDFGAREGLCGPGMTVSTSVEVVAGRVAVSRGTLVACSQLANAAVRMNAAGGQQQRAPAPPLLRVEVARHVARACANPPPPAGGWRDDFSQCRRSVDDTASGTPSVGELLLSETAIRVVADVRSSGEAVPEFGDCVVDGTSWWVSMKWRYAAPRRVCRLIAQENVMLPPDAFAGIAAQFSRAGRLTTLPPSLKCQLLRADDVAMRHVIVAEFDLRVEEWRGEGVVRDAPVAERFVTALSTWMEDELRDSEARVVQSSPLLALQWCERTCGAAEEWLLRWRVPVHASVLAPAGAAFSKESMLAVSTAIASAIRVQSTFTPLSVPAQRIACSFQALDIVVSHEDTSCVSIKLRAPTFVVASMPQQLAQLTASGDGDAPPPEPISFVAVCNADISVSSMDAKALASYELLSPCLVHSAVSWCPGAQAPALFVETGDVQLNAYARSVESLVHVLSDLAAPHACSAAVVHAASVAQQSASTATRSQACVCLRYTLVNACDHRIWYGQHGSHEVMFVDPGARSAYSWFNDTRPRNMPKRLRLAACGASRSAAGVWSEAVLIDTPGVVRCALHVPPETPGGASAQRALFVEVAVDGAHTTVTFWGAYRFSNSLSIPLELRWWCVRPPMRASKPGAAQPGRVRVDGHVVSRVVSVALPAAAAAAADDGATGGDDGGGAWAVVGQASGQLVLRPRQLLGAFSGASAAAPAAAATDSAVVSALLPDGGIDLVVVAQWRVIDGDWSPACQVAPTPRAHAGMSGLAALVEVPACRAAAGGGAAPPPLCVFVAMRPAMVAFADRRNPASTMRAWVDVDVCPPVTIDNHAPIALQWQMHEGASWMSVGGGASSSAAAAAAKGQLRLVIAQQRHLQKLSSAVGTHDDESDGSAQFGEVAAGAHAHALVDPRSARAIGFSRDGDGAPGPHELQALSNFATFLTRAGEGGARGSSRSSGDVGVVAAAGVVAAGGGGALNAAAVAAGAPADGAAAPGAVEPPHGATGQAVLPSVRVPLDFGSGDDAVWSMTVPAGERRATDAPEPCVRREGESTPPPITALPSFPCVVLDRAGVSDAQSRAQAAAAQYAVAIGAECAVVASLAVASFPCMTLSLRATMTVTNACLSDVWVAVGGGRAPVHIERGACVSLPWLMGASGWGVRVALAAGGASPADVALSEAVSLPDGGVVHCTVRDGAVLPVHVKCSTRNGDIALSLRHSVLVHNGTEVWRAARARRGVCACARVCMCLIAAGAAARSLWGCSLQHRMGARACRTVRRVRSPLVAWRRSSWQLPDLLLPLLVLLLLRPTARRRVYCSRWQQQAVSRRILCGLTPSRRAPAPGTCLCRAAAAMGGGARSCCCGSRAPSGTASST